MPRLSSILHSLPTHLPFLRRFVTLRTVSTLPRALVAVLVMAFGTSLIPLMDALAKRLVLDGTPALYAALGRFVSQIILLGILQAALWMLPTRRRGALSRERGLLPAKLDALRGVSMALGTLFFFSSLKFIALPAATAILLLTPVILLLLARIVLGEVIRVFQWVVIGLSFLSALIIIRPSSDIFNLSAILPLLAACSFAIYFLLTRIRAKTASVITNMFVVSVFAALTLAVAVIGAALIWSEDGWLNLPQGRDVWITLSSLGLISATSHIAIFLAMKIGSVGLLAPLIYLEFVSSSVLSVWMFGQFPDRYTIVGALGLIVVNFVNSLASIRRTAP